MTNHASLVTDSGATVMIDGETYLASTDHPNFRAVVDAIRNGDWDAIPDLIDLRAAVRNWMATAFDGDFKLSGDRLSYKSYTFGEAVTSKALSMIDAGNNAKPLLNFLSNVCNNPAHSAREELLLFCAANGFMISTGGNIVAYKAIRDDYTDHYTGKISYRVGATPEMERGAVDDDRNRTCSKGLHFAAQEYAQMFGSGRGRMVVVEVNPADVVSIPLDYNNQKGRCAKMTVICEIEHNTPLPDREVYDWDKDSESWDDDDDDGDDWDRPCDCGDCGDCDEDDDIGFYDDTDAEGNDLYDLGQRHGRRRVPRLYDRGVNQEYDVGYKDGRTDR